jgi:hypothetical protein
MYPFLGFGNITGRPEDKIKDFLGEELAHWSVDVLKGSARGVKHTALTAGSCIALGMKLGDSNSRCIFDKRFASEVKTKGWGYISSKGKNSPIRQITELVVLDAKKNRPNSVAKALAKFVFSNRLKAVTVNVVIAQISSYLVDVTISRYISNQTAKGFVKGVFSVGIGVGISLADVAEQSYQAMLRLKTKNHTLYAELYRKNLECFWWLVEDDLKGLAYKNG